VKYSFIAFDQVGDYYMDYKDVLDIRVYIPMLLVLLIPLGLVRDLRYLVPFSAIANVFIFVSFIITLYYVFKDTLDVGDKNYIADVEQMPLFFATVIFAMEGIGVVSAGKIYKKWWKIGKFTLREIIDNDRNLRL
jgi:amino acid permease